MSLPPWENSRAPRGLTPARARQAGQWLEVKGKAPRADFEHPSEELVDLVRICTAASRCGYGNLVWLGWQPGMPGERVKEPNRVGFGSQLIAVSVQGAARLARRMPGADLVGEPPVPPEQVLTMSHWDLSLKEFLTHDEGRSLAASLCAPAIGSFKVHPSDIDKRYKEGRPACWDEPWCVPGTRPSHDPQGRSRSRVKFVARGKPPVLVPLRIDDSQDLFWRSYWSGSGPTPAPGGSAADEPSASAADPRPRAGGARHPAAPRGRLPPPPPVTSTTVFQRPPGPPPRPPPPRPGMRAQTEPAADEETGKPSKRSRRQQRCITLMRTFRHWTENFDEVASTPRK